MYVVRLLLGRGGRESLWLSTTGVVSVLVGATALGMIVYGDAGYTGASYDYVRRVPGGMRTYGFVLLVLFIILIYGFGQHQLGRSGVLRLGLALTAAWYAAWLVALATTCVLAHQLYSWSGICGNVFIAAIANLVARAVPPDRQDQP